MSNTTSNATEIFRQAIRFDYCVGLLGQHAMLVAHATIRDGKATVSDKGVLSFGKDVDPPSLIPSVVCQAFCVELFLKAILRLENIRIPKTHNLDELYKPLPQNWKDRANAAYLRAIQNEPFDPGYLSFQFATDIYSALMEASKAFENWRYVFEGDPPNYYLGTARQAILEAIFELKPDWKALVDDLRNLKTHLALLD